MRLKLRFLEEKVFDLPIVHDRTCGHRQVKAPAISLRQLAYLALPEEGHSNEQIAVRWQVSEGSVRDVAARAIARAGASDVTQAIEKLQARCKEEAMAKATSMGLLRLDDPSPAMLLNAFQRLASPTFRDSVSFISVKEQFDTSSAMGRAMRNIALTFAELEREMVAERVKDKMLATVRRGRWPGGTVPFGYDLQHGKLTPDPVEAPAVRLLKGGGPSSAPFVQTGGRPRIAARQALFEHSQTVHEA